MAVQDTPHWWNMVQHEAFPEEENISQSSQAEFCAPRKVIEEFRLHFACPEVGKSEFSDSWLYHLNLMWSGPRRVIRNAPCNVFFPEQVLRSRSRQLLPTIASQFVQRRGGVSVSWLVLPLSLLCFGCPQQATSVKLKVGFSGLVKGVLPSSVAQIWPHPPLLLLWMPQLRPQPSPLSAFLTDPKARCML